MNRCLDRRKKEMEIKRTIGNYIKGREVSTTRKGIKKNRFRREKSRNK